MVYCSIFKTDVTLWEFHTGMCLVHTVCPLAAFMGPLLTLRDSCREAVAHHAPLAGVTQLVMSTWETLHKKTKKKKLHSTVSYGCRKTEASNQMFPVFIAHSTQGIQDFPHSSSTQSQVQAHLPRHRLIHQFAIGMREWRGGCGGDGEDKFKNTPEWWMSTDRVGCWLGSSVFRFEAKSSKNNRNTPRTLQLKIHSSWGHLPLFLVSYYSQLLEFKLLISQIVV